MQEVELGLLATVKSFQMENPTYPLVKGANALPSSVWEVFM